MFRSIASTVFVTCTLNFVSHIFVICTAFVCNLLVAVAKAIDIRFNRYFLETFCVLMNCIASKQEFNFVIISMPRLVLNLCRHSCNYCQLLRLFRCWNFDFVIQIFCDMVVAFVVLEWLDKRTVPGLDS